MIGKRALVVDDSRSARTFLGKILAEEQVEFDIAETAEQALDYLERNRPDVIFMDHLMPGMDGFQAVQTIKNNPRTAGIPILMYTSQEGELYLGQARALGAAGVLPKTALGTSVRAALDEIWSASAIVVSPVPEAVPASASAAQPLSAGPAVEELLKQHAADIQRRVAEVEARFGMALEAHRGQLAVDLRALLREALPPAPVVEPEKPRHSPVPWLLAVAASVVAAVLGTLMWRDAGQAQALRNELADTESTVALLTARLVPPAPEPQPVIEAPAGSDAVAVGATPAQANLAQVIAADAAVAQVSEAVAAPPAGAQ